MQPTPKMIEIAARAMCEAWHYAPIGTPDGDAEWKRKQDQYRKQAEAALTAALSQVEPQKVISIPTTADEAEAMEKMGWHWLQTNAPERLTPEGLAEVRRRVVGDVQQHIEMRAELLRLGYLAPPKVWKSGSAVAEAYAP